MRTRPLALSLAAFLAVPAAVYAQPAPGGTGRSLVAPATSVAPTPEELVTACFARCFAADQGLRAQVCGSAANATPNPQLCLNRNDIPACVSAQRALAVGRQVIASAVCGQATLAPVAPASDLAAEERRRRNLERVREQCASQDVFADDCVRCASGGSRWLTVNTPQRREMVRLAAGVAVDASLSHAREASVRCVSRQTESVYAVLADTRVRLENLTVTVQGPRPFVASSAPAADGPSSDQTLAFVRVARLQADFVRLSGEASAAVAGHEVCRLSQRLPPRPVPGITQAMREGRTPAPAEMQFWPDDAVRAAPYNYEPRHSFGTLLEYSRCDQAEARRIAAVRAADEARARLDGLLVALDQVATACGTEPTGTDCRGARNVLHALVNDASPSAATAVRPQAAPPAPERRELVMSGE